MTSDELDFRLLALFLADHAEAINGKVYVNGGFFNRMVFPTYPQAVPTMAVVAVCEVPFARYLSEHRFTIGLLDQDGHAIPFKIEGSFRVGAGPEIEFGDSTVMPIAVPIYGLVLQQPGDYCFTFSIDDKELGRWSFRAVQVASPLQFKFAPPPPPQSEAS